MHDIVQTMLACMPCTYLPSIPIGTCQRGAATKRGKAALIGAAAWGLIYSTSQHYTTLYTCTDNFTYYHE